MAILKKPEPNKRNCPPPITVSGMSMLMGAAAEAGGLRNELNKVQLDIVKADLRERLAKADMAETEAAYAKARLEDHLAARAKKTSRK